MIRNRYASATDPAEVDRLASLDAALGRFYTETPYHHSWIKGLNTGWSAQTHPAQTALAHRIPDGAAVLEVGCGDGAAAPELFRLATPGSYLGVDLNRDAWADRPGYDFRVGRADALPVDDARFDVVASMFVLEHLVYPHRFLEEAWRALRPGGRLLLVAPDFWKAPMSGEWLGVRYGSGRTKLAEGRWADALLTLAATRLTVPRQRRRRARALRAGQTPFPILINPRCLEQPGFVPDCDAVYPSCPEEVEAFLRRKPDFAGATVFYRGPSAFGIEVAKAS